MNEVHFSDGFGYWFMIWFNNSYVYVYVKFKMLMDTQHVTIFCQFVSHMLLENT